MTRTSGQTGGKKEQRKEDRLVFINERDCNRRKWKITCGHEYGWMMEYSVVDGEVDDLLGQANPLPKTSSHEFENFLTSEVGYSLFFSGVPRHNY
jgi:hypothetical protein